MENILYRELGSFIIKYLDIERLLRENPSVTREMIDAFLHVNFNTPEKPVAPYPPDTHISKRKEETCSEFIIHTDGASRGNPGKAGIGVAIYDRNYNLVEQICKFIGESTNNVAEYQAMILATQKAIACKAQKVTFKTDSELLVRQLNGLYKVRNPGLVPLYNELRTLLSKIPDWKILHVRREENVLADKLANDGIDTAYV